MTDTICPACGTARATPKTRITRCAACGHRWLINTADEHREVEEAVYHDHYAGYRDDPRFRQAIRDAITRYISPRVAPGATLLDVGCGSGDLLQAAVELGYQGRGIDVSPSSASICRSKGLDAVSGDFLTYDFGQKFDAITMWDVMEHLRDPAAFLDRVRSLLAPGGYYFAKIPGFGEISVGVSTYVPRAAGILLGAPDHVQYFDTESLDKLVRRMGFSVDWLTTGPGMRTAATGGTLKRRAGRLAARAIRTVSGDANLYLAASPVE